MFTKSARLLHPNWWQGCTWRTIVMRLHVRKINVATLTPETAGTKGVWAEVGRIFHPGWSHGCGPARVRMLSSSGSYAGTDCSKKAMFWSSLTVGGSKTSLCLHIRMRGAGWCEKLPLIGHSTFLFQLKLICIKKALEQVIENSPSYQKDWKSGRLAESGKV